MNRLALPALLLAAVVATPAAALLPPRYYQEARDKAAHVVVFDVTHVGVPAGVSGDCNVEGKVIRDERGDLKPGDAVKMAVPCRTPLATPMPGPVIWQDMEALSRSAHGKAYLDAEGNLALYQYELYDLH
ncbi:MAG: hypothetical protein KA105_08565 [Caulobacter sp.]|nr:hypothetical protein [Caulobacter sp.]